MAEKKEYCIWSGGAPVLVNQEVYQACYQTKRYVKTQYEKDARHNLVSYDGMDTEDTLGVETISDPDAPSVEDIAVANILKEELHRCLAMLPKQERKLIHALYFERLSERQYAQKIGVHYMTIHSRKEAILRTLKKLMKS